MQTASIIFLDAPVGTGFSYARTPEGWPSSDSESAEQSYQFLRKVLHKNSCFKNENSYFFDRYYYGRNVENLKVTVISSWTTISSKYSLTYVFGV
jgi:serine carboxypeptidase-like clade 1